jgi:hypothetical protein
LGPEKITTNPRRVKIAEEIRQIASRANWIANHVPPALILFGDSIERNSQIAGKGQNAYKIFLIFPTPL